MKLANPYLAILDTCVLAPMPLCDTLLRLAEEPAFYTPKWSAHTMVELEGVLVRRWRHSSAQAEHRVREMNRAFPDARVSGHEGLEAAMTNAVEDRHVLAAAVRCGAHAIVTANLRDFPPEAVRPCEVEVISPDDFLLHQFHLSPEAFERRIARQAMEAGFTWDALLTRLGRNAPNCVAALAERAADSGQCH